MRKGDPQQKDTPLTHTHTQLLVAILDSQCTSFRVSSEQYHLAKLVKGSTR